jgi:hypothetical protein
VSQPGIRSPHLSTFAMQHLLRIDGWHESTLPGRL